MKTLVSAVALLVGSNVMAVAADQTLKIKLVAFNVGEKDGEYHFVGATVSPDGAIGTKDFSVKEDQNGKGTGHSTYYFPDGSIVANDSFMDTATQTGGPCCRHNPDRFRNRRLSGRDRLGILRGRLGRQEPTQERHASQHWIGREDPGILRPRVAAAGCTPPPRLVSQKRGATGRLTPPVWVGCTVPQTSWLRLPKAGRRS